LLRAAIVEKLRQKRGVEAREELQALRELGCRYESMILASLARLGPLQWRAFEAMLAVRRALGLRSGDQEE
jgi:hypothetical protein